MPLLKGKKNFGRNVEELIKAFKKKGKIGNVKPRDLKHARKVALAIAFQKLRKG